MKKVKSNAPRGGPSKTTHKNAKFSVDGDESDDGMSLNLQGREILDRNSKVTVNYYIVKCTHILHHLMQEL